MPEARTGAERTVDIYSDIPRVPEKYASKKKKPKEIAVVEPGNCTGCEICVPFCPVNCIEVAPRELDPSRPIPPVRIRYNECIGCEICVRACDKLAWNAITMVPTEVVEKTFGITVTEKFLAPKPAATAQAPVNS